MPEYCPKAARMPASDASKHARGALERKSDTVQRVVFNAPKHVPNAAENSAKHA